MNLFLVSISPYSAASDIHLCILHSPSVMSSARFAGVSFGRVFGRFASVLAVVPWRGIPIFAAWM